jgi:hypothetical protein
MDIAAVMFLASLFVPPVAVAAGAAIVLWPRRGRASRTVVVEKTAAQR